MKPVGMKPGIVWGLVEVVPDIGENSFIVLCGMCLKKSLVLVYIT